jgi:hypothetical protein
MQSMYRAAGSYDEASLSADDVLQPLHHTRAYEFIQMLALLRNIYRERTATDYKWPLGKLCGRSGRRDRYQGYHTGAMAGCSGRPCRACRQQQDHTMEHLCLLTMPYNHTTTLVLTSSYKCPRCFATASGSIQVKGVKHVH